MEGVRSGQWGGRDHSGQAPRCRGLPGIFLQGVAECRLQSPPPKMCSEAEERGKRVGHGTQLADAFF